MIRTVPSMNAVTGKSFLGGLDPLSKLMALAVLSVGTMGYDWAASWPVLGLLLAGVLASGVGVREYARGLKPILFLAFAGVVVHGLSTPGKVLAETWGGFSVTREGLSAGFLVAFRLTLLAAFARLLTVSTPPADILGALERISGPLERAGVPVGSFFRSILMAIDVLPLVKEEGETVFRGLPKGLGRVKSLLSGVEELLRRVLRRSDAIFQNGVEVAHTARPKGFGSAEWSLIGLALAVSIYAATGAFNP